MNDKDRLIALAERAEAWATDLELKRHVIHPSHAESARIIRDLLAALRSTQAGRRRRHDPEASD